MLPLQSVRLVWFPTDNVGVELAQRLYHDLFQAQPDRSTTSKHPTPQNPFSATAAGNVAGFEVEVQQQVGRVDLVVQPVDATGGEPMKGPAVIEAETAIEFVRSAIKKSSQLPLSQRISCVATALDNVSGLEEATSNFFKFMGVDVGVDKASDHHFQINKRKTLAGVECNRLIQLHVAEFQSVQFAFSGLGLGSNQPPASVRTSFAFSVLYDFNTVLNGDIFDVMAQKPVFDALLCEILKSIEFGNIDFLRRQ